MKKSFLRTIAILLVAFCLPLAAGGEALGNYAVDFTATTLDGKQVTMSTDFQGKLILLDFWATWCVPCMEEVPGLVEAYKEYSKRGVVFLGITLDSPGDRKDVVATMKEMGMVWTQIFDESSDADGKGTIISDAYKVEGIPSPFLIDGSTGLIIARDSELRGESLVGTLEEALAAKK